MSEVIKAYSEQMDELVKQIALRDRQIEVLREAAKKFNLFCLDKGITLLEIGQQNRMTFNAGGFIDARIEFEKAFQATEQKESADEL